MAKRIAAAFAELKPEGLTPKSDGLQDRKSSETRETILEATIECLARYGYARTTNQLICEIAKVSRGALLHHYATQQELMVAVIEYAFYKHMRSFSAAIRALTDEERVDRNAGIVIDWQHCLSKEYQAYMELRMAARTDDGLRAIFLPRARHHARVWKDELLDVFPEWRSDLQKLELTRRLMRSALEGLAMNRDIWGDGDAEASVLGLLADIAQQLRVGKLSFPSPSVSRAKHEQKAPARRTATRSQTRS